MSIVRTKTKNAAPQEEEIDLLALLLALKDHAVLIIAVGLIFGLLFGLGTMIFIPKEYTSSFTAYVNNSMQDKAMQNSYTVSNSDITASKSLATTYCQIITGRTVLTTAAERVGLNYSAKALSEMVSAGTVNSTEIIKVTVTTKDPATSRALADSIAFVSQQTVASIIDGSSMRIIDEPVTPDRKSAPSTSKNAAMGALADMVLVCAVIVVKELLDDTVRDEATLEERFGLMVLGTIPNAEYAGKSGGKYGYASAYDRYAAAANKKTKGGAKE